MSDDYFVGQLGFPATVTLGNKPVFLKIQNIKFNIKKKRINKNKLKLKQKRNENKRKG